MLGNYVLEVIHVFCLFTQASLRWCTQSLQNLNRDLTGMN